VEVVFVILVLGSPAIDDLVLTAGLRSEDGAKAAEEINEKDKNK